MQQRTSLRGCGRDRLIQGAKNELACPIGHPRTLLQGLEEHGQSTFWPDPARCTNANRRQHHERSRRACRSPRGTGSSRGGQGDGVSEAGTPCYRARA